MREMNWFQKYVIAPIAIALMFVSWLVFQIMMFVPFIPVTLLKFASGNSLMGWEEWKELISESWSDLFQEGKK